MSLMGKLFGWMKPNKEYAELQALFSEVVGITKEIDKLERSQKIKTEVYKEGGDIEGLKVDKNFIIEMGVKHGKELKEKRKELGDAEAKLRLIEKRLPNLKPKSVALFEEIKKKIDSV